MSFYGFAFWGAAYRFLKSIFARPERKMRKIAVLALGLALLAGCGIKPSHVDPPEGANEGDFPRVYPDVKTDPGADAAKTIR